MITIVLPARINIGWLGAALATIALIIGNWPGAAA